MLVALPLVAVLTASCPSAAAEAARSRYQAFDYPGTLEAVADVEACFDGSGEELAEAFRWRAQAQAASKNTDAAIDAFALAATVWPTYVLDPMVAPKVHALFNQARQRVNQGKSLFARVTARKGSRLAIEVFDPLKKARGVRVAWVGGNGPAMRASDGSWHLTIPDTITAVKLRVDSSEADPFTSREIPLPGAKVLTPPTPVVVAEPEVKPVEPAVAAATAPDAVASTTEPQPPRKIWPIAVGVGAGVVAIIAISVGVGVAAANARFDGSLGKQELGGMSSR